MTLNGEGIARLDRVNSKSLLNLCWLTKLTFFMSWSHLDPSTDFSGFLDECLDSLEWSPLLFMTWICDPPYYFLEMGNTSTIVSLSLGRLILPTFLPSIPSQNCWNFSVTVLLEGRWSVFLLGLAVFLPVLFKGYL